jgi:hypothetical protein
MSYFFFQELKLFNGSVWNVAKALIDPSGDLFKLALEQAKLKCGIHYVFFSIREIKKQGNKIPTTIDGLSCRSICGRIL